MSKVEAVKAKPLVKADIRLWQAGKSLEEMKEYENSIVSALKKVVTKVAGKRIKFNVGHLWSALKAEGYTIAHSEIVMLMAQDLGLSVSPKGSNTFLSEPAVSLYPEPKPESEEKPSAPAKPVK